MGLRERQIEAVKKTLNQVKKEYNDGSVYHHWNGKCSLCIAFPASCRNCPLPLGCVGFAMGEGYEKEAHASPIVPVEDVAGYLQSLLITLKMMKRR